MRDTSSYTTHNDSSGQLGREIRVRGTSVTSSRALTLNVRPLVSSPHASAQILFPTATSPLGVSGGYSAKGYRIENKDV